MRVSLRLLFTLAFVVFVLPKIVTYYWDEGAGKDKENFNRNEQILNNHAAAVEQHEAGLSASLDEISFEDPAFKKCVSSTLARLKGVIDGSGYNAASDIKVLHCDGRKITSIHGVEYLPNIVDLSLRNNYIQDLNPAGQLPNLQIIDLSGNDELENIDALLYARNLTKISVRDQKNLFCYEIESVIDHVKSNRPANSSPIADIRNIRCRGKKTDRITKLLERRHRGDDLTFDESQKLEDYEFDQAKRNNY